MLSLGVPLYLWFLLRVCTRLGWSGRPGESGLVDELDGSVEEERRMVEEAVGRIVESRELRVEGQRDRTTNEQPEAPGVFTGG